MGARRVRVEDVRSDGDETTVLVTADPRVVQATEEAVRRRVAERLGAEVSPGRDPEEELIRAAAEVAGSSRSSLERRGALREARRLIGGEER